VILFPGLAADGHLFSQIGLINCKVIVAEFLSPLRNESLQHYAKRIALSLPHHEDIIFAGVSFGGILAQEVSKFIPAKKVILISSVSSSHQKPLMFFLFKILPLYKMLSVWSLKNFIIWIGKRFTIKNKDEQALFESMVEKADGDMIRWGISKTLFWKQGSRQPGIIQIHGTKDRVFPIRRIEADYIIPGGQHFMIIQRGAEISDILNRIIQNS
jgi:hypothetical protein